MPRRQRNRPFQMYIVQGGLLYTNPEGWRGRFDFPTFFLHPDVQMIPDLAAARSIVDGMFGQLRDWGLKPAFTVELVEITTGGEYLYPRGGSRIDE